MNEQNNNKGEYEILRLINEAKQTARLEEAAKWKAKIQELKKLTDNDEWVDTKQALAIIKKKSVNTLKAFIKNGIIEQPRKIGRCWYYRKSNLLNLFEYEADKK